MRALALIAPVLTVSAAAEAAICALRDDATRVLRENFGEVPVAMIVGHKPAPKPGEVR